MKKILLLLFFAIPFFVKCQFTTNYPVYEYERYHNEWDSDDHNARIMNIMAVEQSEPDITYLRIKTHIPISRENCFITVFIKGYDEIHGNINLQVGWHWFDGGFQAFPSVSSSGTYTPIVNVGHDGDNFCITLDNRESSLSNAHFEISALVNGDVNRSNFDITDFWWWEIDHEGLVDGLECKVFNKFNELKADNINTETITAKNGTFNNLNVINGNRNYVINKVIGGRTSTVDNYNSCPNTNYSDACIKSYLILHEAYNSTLLPESYVMGKITAIRGGIGMWNYKISMEVNTAAAYNTTRGSLINYAQEGVTKLVTVFYLGRKYLAIEINQPSSIYGFSFTGYAENEVLRLVPEKEIIGSNEFYTINITNVQPFTSIQDPVSIQGPLRLENLANATTDNVLTTDVKGNLVLTNGGGYWKKQTSTPTNIYYNGGAVAIGNSTDITPTTNLGSYQLVVAGKIGARRVQVTQQAWADYVFKKDYKLMPLSQLAKFINTNGHLPDVPTESEVSKNGNDVGDTQALLLKKIEELTIYIIQQQKEIDALKKATKKIK